MSPELRRSLMLIRRALLMLLDAIEDALGMPRSVPRRGDRREAA